MPVPSDGTARPSVEAPDVEAVMIVIPFDYRSTWFTVNVDPMRGRCPGAFATMDTFLFQLACQTQMTCCNCSRISLFDLYHTMTCSTHGRQSLEPQQLGNICTLIAFLAVGRGRSYPPHTGSSLHASTPFVHLISVQTTQDIPERYRDHHVVPPSTSNLSLVD